MLVQQNFMVPDWLKRQAELNRDRIAVSAEEESITYGQLYQRAKSLAATLGEHGIVRDVHVAVLVKSGFWFTLMVHALIQTGAVLVPLNWRLSKTEMAFQIKDSSASAILYDCPFSDMVNSLSVQMNHSINTFAVEELMNFTRGPSIPVYQDLVCLADVQAVLYTSGTTGFPKGARISYSNHLYNTLGIGIRFGLRPGDKWLVPMPLFHVAGLAVLMRSVIYGMSIVIQSTFDAVHVNRALDEEHISIVSLVPAMLARMLKLRQGKRYPESLRVVFLGGSATPRPLMENALELDVPVYQSYGLTETDSAVCVLPASDGLRKLGSSGQALFPTEVAISQGGQLVHEPNVEGEIIIRGPTVITGYLNKEDANQGSFIGGWFRTGDIGYLDSEGYLYVLDRRTDLIVSGGENIYPSEVESVLLAHAQVEEAGVVGMEHEQWGQVPVAFIKPFEGASLSGEDLVAFCGERLAKFKIPTQFNFVESLPRNASGKLLRKSLRECLMR